MRLLAASRGVALLLAAGSTGCCYVAPYRTPPGPIPWQDTAPPHATLAAKALAYQERLERRHRTPEGVIRYAVHVDEPDDGYGDLADGPFHTGIYLASQALRLAATGDPAARREIHRALDGLELLHRVTGVRGLLARYVAPATLPRGAGWQLSTSTPRYAWRTDASKDQYAGALHGLGVTLAVVDDRAIRAEAAALAAAIADHLDAHGLRIVDPDGEPTTHGDLRPRELGVPFGTDALIVLAAFRVAAEATGDRRRLERYRQLVEDGLPDIAWWAHFSLLGVGNRVNDHLAYLALYPLLALERDAAVRADLRRAGERSWAAVADDENAFFAFVHAARVAVRGSAEAAAAIAQGRRVLGLFPEEKVAWPVDLTRPGFDFPRTCLNGRKCLPKTDHGLPAHLRHRTSSLWASDPYQLVGHLDAHGDVLYAGVDYLIAYWLGRYHGWIEPTE